MPDWKALIANRRVQIGAIASVCVVVALVGWFLHAAASPPGPQPPPPSQPSAAAPEQPAATEPAPPATPPEPPKTTARITFTTVPPVHATVSWGKTRLGVITPKLALVIERPRDSGPLDVVVKAAGYLPVQTRAHTFGDSRIVVKLTKPDQTQTLIGYKAPLDAGPPEETSAEEIIAPPPFP
jgi:hypothetical protein